jgi:uridine phosphorylase|tara:strand:- start:31171 stop:32031 length:861 start_codon:yes stop_codon:yes gene_type:complete
MSFKSSELVLNNKNQVYHLGLHAKDISEKIILVGDQDRVELVTSFFDSVEHKSQHREFVCHTGIYKGKRITVLSSGIGTDNIDIVVNELDILANINLETKELNAEHKSLEMIRIGTCGILQSDIPIHQYILSEMAMGLDNVAHFYDIKFTPEEESLLEEIKDHCPFPPKVEPYLISTNPELTAKLEGDKTFKGITLTASGFYGPQGRAIRLPLKNNWRETLEDSSFQGKAITNFEMESSALFAVGRSLGHSCTTICLGIANRPTGEFSKDYSVQMNELIKYVLDRF